jgi:hypothetical protein
LSVYEDEEFCFNESIPGTGLLISHLRPNQSISSQFRWEPADNDFLLNDDGEDSDTYKPGNATAFTPYTTPNSNDGSSWTGIAVTDIHYDGNDIVCDVFLN